MKLQIVGRIGNGISAFIPPGFSWIENAIAVVPFLVNRQAIRPPVKDIGDTNLTELPLAGVCDIVTISYRVANVDWICIISALIYFDGRLAFVHGYYIVDLIRSTA
jgi:hypothetical protein